MAKVTNRVWLGIVLVGTIASLLGTRVEAQAWRVHRGEWLRGRAMSQARWRVIPLDPILRRPAVLGNRALRLAPRGGREAAAYRAIYPLVLGSTLASPFLIPPPPAPTPLHPAIPEGAILHEKMEHRAPGTMVHDTER